MAGAKASTSQAFAYLYLQGQPQPIELGQKFQFGRTTAFSDSAVSVRHFTIAANAGGSYYILDSNSRTGTKLNGKAIKANEWVELREGMQIVAGPYSFQFSTKINAVARTPAKPAHAATKPPVPTKQPGAQRPTPPGKVNSGKKEVLCLAATPKVVVPISADHRRKLSQNARESLESDSHKNDNTFLVAMASLNIIIFAFQLMTGGGLSRMSASHMLSFGANAPYLTTDGQWWRLFSAAFLHWDIWHLVGNVGAMYFATAFIIQYLTPNKIIAVYLGSAFCANILSALYQPSHAVIAGASGAVFGLYGAIIVSAIMYHSRGIKMDKGLILTAMYFAWENLGYGKEGVDFWGHLGGLMGGAIICYACLQLLPENDKKSAGGLFGSLALIMVLVVFVMPIKKISGDRQMGIHYARLLDILEVYYENIKAYDRDHNLLRYDKMDTQLVKAVKQVEMEVRAEKPVDQLAAAVQSKILRLTKVTVNHSHYIKHFAKTGSKKSDILARKEDHAMADLLTGINRDLGMPVPESAAVAPKKNSRTPSARK